MSEYGGVPKTTTTTQEGFWRMFLMREPRPTLARLYNETGESKDLPIPVDVVWARLGQTVAALEPSLVELYDDEMQLLRAEKGKTERKNSTGVVLPFPLHNDPNAALLGYFASLLAQAHSFSHQAFDVLRELVANANTDNASLRQELSELRTENAELKTDLAAALAGGGGEGDTLENLAATFMNGHNAAKAEAVKS